VYPLKSITTPKLSVPAAQSPNGARISLAHNSHVHAMVLISRRNAQAFAAGYRLYNRYSKWRTNRTYGGPRRRSTPTGRKYRPRVMRYNTYKGNWKTRARRRVALPRNFASSKTVETVLPNNRDTARQIINPQALIFINTGSGIENRERDQVYISGIKLNAHFSNNTGERVWVNWAVIYPKRDRVISNQQADFFRDYTDERAWNANNATKQGLSWANAEINPDEFVILNRGKFLLAPGNQTGTGGIYNKNDCLNDIERYIKLGRTFTFDGPIEAVDQQIYFVTWVANSTEGAGFNIGVANSMSWKLRAIVYFREPKTA